jgi:hypothetical protein
LIYAACAALCAACVSARTGVRTAEVSSTAEAPVEPITGLTAAIPKVSLIPDRDVVVSGQVPSIVVEVQGVARDEDQPWKLKPRRVLGPDGQPVDGPCDEARAPEGKWGTAEIDLSCVPLARAGRYVIELDLAGRGFGQDVLELPIRVLAEPPEARAVPPGWVAVPLAAELPQLDCTDAQYYSAELASGQLVLGVYVPPAAPALPAALRNRIPTVDGLRYVSEWSDGFMLMADRGEWGGGLAWLPRSSGPAIPIVISLPGEQDPPPQNVQRAQRVGDRLYLLQGITHLGLWEGQLAAVWRERERFRTRVIARYRSEPFAWDRIDDGRWLVVTSEAIWLTSESGTNTLVAYLPNGVAYPNSLVRTADGTLLIGMREGVLRLTPTWEDAPRYAAELLVPQERRNHPCKSWLDELEQ